MNRPKLKTFSITVLAVVAINSFLINGSASAQSEIERRIKIAQKVKATFDSLESDQEVLALVELRNKKKIVGYIENVRKAFFIAAEMNTGNAVEVRYENISKIRLVVFQRPSLPPVIKINYRFNQKSIYKESKI